MPQVCAAQVTGLNHFREFGSQRSVRQDPFDTRHYGLREVNRPGKPGAVQSAVFHASTLPAARLREDSRTTEPKTYPVDAPVRHCPARQRRSLPVRRYRRRQRSLVSICEKPLQRARPLRHRCGRLPRFAGAYERPAPLELVEPFLDRHGFPRNRTDFGHRLATTGHGDGLPSPHVADDLGEPRPRVVHGISEIHVDEPNQSHQSGQGEGWPRMARGPKELERPEGAAPASSGSSSPRCRTALRWGQAAASVAGARASPPRPPAARRGRHRERLVRAVHLSLSPVPCMDDSRLPRYAWPSTTSSLADRLESSPPEAFSRFP